MKRILNLLFASSILLSCSSEPEQSIADEAQAFIDDYTTTFLELYYTSAKAEWKANTKIYPGDTITEQEAKDANEAFAKFSGSQEVIENAKKYLESKDQLDELQVKQLEKILYAAANNPESAGEATSKRIEKELKQNTDLFGFKFVMDGDTVSTNQIDQMLVEETDVAKRQKVWESSKEVGVVLRDGLAELRDLRNETVQNLGYENYFAYQVSDYEMSVDEMMQLNEQLISDVWPLYRELHTYMRYEMAEKYGEEVPQLLPAHWLPNRWGQDWSEVVEVEGFDLDAALEEKGDEWLLKQSERFYVSLGFEELPASFWELSDLYPLPEGADYSKNNHASAWHMDLKNDVRSLMSVEPNTRWYETTHHEYGHIYYYMAYTNPNVPPLLRGGANRAYHEAIGSMLGLAAMQKPFIENLGLIEPGTETDELRILLKEALNYITFIPFSAGVMTHFEHDLYSRDISAEQFNEVWWSYKRKYQGIEPPSERGPEYCDAASKTHINNDAAQYYDYALSYALLFQFHNHIAREILKQDPRNTNYYGSKEVGDFLYGVLSPGATKDWRVLLEESTGQAMSAKPMLEYFAPLTEYLKELNEGRDYALPESI